jgi:hypothetical protein
MKAVGKASGLAAVLGLLCAFSCVAGQETVQPSETSISLQKVGPADVGNAEHVVLEQPIANLFGHAWNYQNKEFYGLIKSRDGRQWYVAAASKSEPGGVFNIEGVRFPQSGDFELVVALKDQDSLSLGSLIDESQWRDQALAVTQSISVTVETPPDVADDDSQAEPSISILSVADVSLAPHGTNSVPAAGDVILKARGLPDSKFYVAAHAPYTDRCFILGPAEKSALPDTYIIHSATFEIPGDPQQIHFELVAFAADRPVGPGPLSWRSFSLAEYVTSPTVNILIDARQLRSDSLRIPFINITRVGQHALNAGQPSSRRLDVEQGDVLEVNGYERVAEGATLWALTRPTGSNVWLAQGPLLPRGNTSTAYLEARPLVTWVLPGLQFAHPDRKGANGDEFEIMAILSTAIFPNSWVSNTSLSSQSVETVSQPVSVHVHGAISPPPAHLSIAQVGGQEVDPGSELTVGDTENVVIDSPEDFSQALKIYVGKHVIGSTTWSFVEALRNGETFFIPDLSFSHPHAVEGTRYQIIAIVTNGPLPVRETEYQDFLPHVLTASDPINVRYSRSFFSAFFRWLSSWFAYDPAPGAAGSASQEVKSNMWWIWPLLALIALLFLLAALTWLIFHNAPALSGQIADTLQRGHASAKKRFEQPASVNMAYFILGMLLLTAILYLIRSYYLHLYTTIIATVTNLPQRESAGFAIWLILITALAGIFADIAFKLSRQPRSTHADDDPAQDPRDGAQEQSQPGIHKYIFAASMLIAIILWVFQAGIYYAFIAQTAGKNTPIVLPALGGLAAFVISMTETIAFFIITELSLIPAGWLVLVLVLAPLYLMSLFFRFVQRFFEHRRAQAAPPIAPSPPERGGTRPASPAPVEPLERRGV